MCPCEFEKGSPLKISWTSNVDWGIGKCRIPRPNCSQTGQRKTKTIHLTDEVLWMDKRSWCLRRLTKWHFLRDPNWHKTVVSHIGTHSCHISSSFKVETQDLLRKIARPSINTNNAIHLCYSTNLNLEMLSYQTGFHAKQKTPVLLLFKI